MKKFLSVLLAVALVCSLTVPVLADETEEDVTETVNYEEQEPSDPTTDEETTTESDNAPIADGEEDAAHPADEPAEESHWYDAAVQTVTEQGVMTGGDSGFDPDGVATRAAVVQTLYNMAGRPAADNTIPAFPDARGKWYETAARWAQQYSITTGDENGRFNGDHGITRAELAVFLYRYALYEGVFVTCDGDLWAYRDGTLVPGWAAYAMQWAVGYRVVNGTSDGYLVASATATRAELAQTLTNFIAVIRPEDATMGTVPGEGATPLPMEGHGAHTAEG